MDYSIFHQYLVKHDNLNNKEKSITKCLHVENYK
jgi:hypothetical protein